MLPVCYPFRAQPLPADFLTTLEDYVKDAPKVGEGRGGADVRWWGVRCLRPREGRRGWRQGRKGEVYRRRLPVAVRVDEKNYFRRSGLLSGRPDGWG